MPRSLLLTLPWPPSVNAVWRNVGKRTILSADARAYRKAVGDYVLSCQIPRFTLKGRLSAEAIAHGPDKREYDLDNRWKAMLDAIQHAGVIENDSQFDGLIIWRDSPRPPDGRVQLLLKELA